VEHGQEQYVKHVQLPSGRTIEVVYFRSGQRTPAPGVPAGQAAPVEGHGASLKVSPARELHLCEECGSDLVYPREWSEEGPEHWRVWLRCPNCEWHGSGVFCQEVVDIFDEQLDLGIEALVDDLKGLMQANMSEEIERFVRALELDAILPEDF
jgi:hypothetical protein